MLSFGKYITSGRKENERASGYENRYHTDWNRFHSVCCGIWGTVLDSLWYIWTRRVVAGMLELSWDLQVFLFHRCAFPPPPLPHFHLLKAILEVQVEVNNRLAEL